MRRLILMRHAKSDWADAGLADEQRPLNARGRRDAPRMARWLKTHGYVPDAILASTALRVRETIDGLLGSCETKPPVHFNPALYLASPEQLLRVVRGDALQYETVMVIAHNPGLQALVSGLAGQSWSMPTAAVVVFDLEIDDWSTLTGHSDGRLVDHKRPKTLDA